MAAVARNRYSMEYGDAVDTVHARYRSVEDPRLSADEMDIQRQENIAYEYLCHLEEAKVWIEACIGEEIPATVELEEGLRNGVVLAKLAHFIIPDKVPLRKVYDKDLSRYNSRGLHFRHTDNINFWLRALEDIELPRIFYPETMDIYDRKNMPRVIYCIHALSLYLFKLGRAPQIQDLYGKIKFTDEEISNMRRELDKYGIQMPAFSKIGGMLAHEMPVDEAALHASIIAINDAVDRCDAMTTVSCLLNPAAHMSNIMRELGEDYQSALFDAKQLKKEIAFNKSVDASYVADVYDELLTQAEIQGNVNKVNVSFAVSMVNAAAIDEDEASLLYALQLPYLRLSNVVDSNASTYLRCLTEAQQYKSDDDTTLSRDDIQQCVAAANEEMETNVSRRHAIDAVNEALQSDNHAATLRTLHSPALQLSALLQPSADSFYHEELRCMREEKQESLNYEEILRAVEVLSAIVKINAAAELDNSAWMYDCLAADDAHIINLDSACREKYHRQLFKAKAAKLRESSLTDMLRHYEIQQCIDDVNLQVASEHNRILSVSEINEAVDRQVVSQTLSALQSSAASLSNVTAGNAVHYQQLLARVKSEKAQETGDPSAVLWYEEIQQTVDMANAHTDEAVNVSMCVGAINVLVSNGDSQNLLSCLQDERSQLDDVSPQYVDAYLHHLTQLKNNRSHTVDVGSGWMMNRISDGFNVYFNVDTMQHSWLLPESVTLDPSLLTHTDIQSCISEVSSVCNRHLRSASSESVIVLIQSCIRGFLARKHLASSKTFAKSARLAAVKIQSWWRMVRQRRCYLDRLHYFNARHHAATQLQANVKAYLTRKNYTDKLDFYRQHVDAVIKIQAFMRSVWAQQDYRSLMSAMNPSISTVRKFVHLLDVGDNDYTEEFEMEKLRQQVVTDIRLNKQLETDLNQMDIKIGLLVKNRITLQDVLSQHKKLKTYSSAEVATHRTHGLKSLCKANRDRLQAYQHLFYILQTNPVYLARLIFALPQSRTTKFMESAILTLYNYASNQREEYLLLKLFKTALQQEVSSMTGPMTDIITGNPMVVKMIVSFNRNARGQGALRELLNPLVTSVVDDASLQINTNPVEVYKQWINQNEAETGQTSHLPYDVTPEAALQHDAVLDRIQRSMQCLQDTTEYFLSAILQSVDKIPYGMRYMAKTMHAALSAHYPNAPEKDILKIVGNLIYYRYINSAVVAPDAFDIIDVGVVKGLTNDQRRNLGSVAKMLQFAASNKGFGADSAHLTPLNKYIMDAHSRFKQFFTAVCDVDEPELMFNIDQYSDVTCITKPVIYISISEIVEIHKLLVEHVDVIAPDPHDMLHELLDDLGEVQDVDFLIGENVAEDDNVLRSQLAKTEISLTLSNKHELPDNDDADKTRLLLRTKQMIVDVLCCQKSGDSLIDILQHSVTPDEEVRHQELIKLRQRVDQNASAVVKQSKLKRQPSLMEDTQLSLETMKCKTVENLCELEKLGVVSAADGYQHIISSIAQDIRNQRLYRHRRKQDMLRLKRTLKGLAMKRSFYEEQINYYSQYVKTCLDNLAAKRKSSRKTQPKITVKYSAARLHEKGVVLEIEGLPHSQFKNVLFEISSTESSGVFEVNAKFMGVNMDKVELLFQDLLQLQYEGVAIMRMFDRAQVNVNLLIFLLNRKFFGKK